MLFFVWLLIVPTGIIYVFFNIPPSEVNWYYLSIFVMLGVLSMYFPILRGNKPVFLVMWVTVPAFLMYGLFVEILIMQVSVIALLFSFRNSLSYVHRFFANSILFFLLSVIAAFIFNAVGGEIRSLEFWPVVLGVFAYQLTHSLAKDTFLKIYTVYKKTTSTYLTKEFIAHYAIILVVCIPLSLILYFLLELTGISSFFLVGFPFFFIALVIRLYKNSEKINDSLQRAGDIGSELSAAKTEKEVIDQFIVKVSGMFGAEFAYIFDYKDDWLELIRSCENQQLIDIDFTKLAAGQGLAGSVLEKNEPIIYSAKEEWEQLSKYYTPEEMQSVLCVPITRNQKVEAVLLLGSKRKSAFKDYQLKILDLLCSYFTVSVEKARYMEKAVTKSERCALTKLYNYRYLEERLHYDMGRLEKNEISDLSVVMLDIDHFKNVNDTYGHQSGNDILYLLAVELKKLVPTGGTVCRYGGEEFVYILPNTSKQEAYDFAENLRLKISEQPFIITSDLSQDRGPLNVQITSSIGVSSAPEDTDEAMILLRNVDRALYVGAKQSGRNRVATYVK